MKKLEFSAKSGRLLKQLEESGVPYAAAQKALRGKDVLVNGQRVKGDVPLAQGDSVCVFFNEPKVTVVYEDERLLVVDKPQGLATEGENALEEKVHQTHPTARLCHRLDQNTGGLVLFAKDEEAYEAVFAAMKERTLRKFYRCIVAHAPCPREATARAFLKKDAQAAYVTVFDCEREGAKEIVTAYKTLHAGALSLLEVELITGRTHQIRAHLAHLGCPIVGDDKYGDRTLNKSLGVKLQALFAVRLELHFPKGSPLAHYNGLSIEAEPRFSKKLNEAMEE